MRNECDGCRTYQNFQHGKCADTKIEHCPCRNCLVKVMCDWACNKLQLHWERNAKCPYK